VINKKNILKRFLLSNLENVAKPFLQCFLIVLIENVAKKKPKLIVPAFLHAKMQKKCQTDSSSIFTCKNAKKKMPN
jgi:hypothetical protein